MNRIKYDEASYKIDGNFKTISVEELIKLSKINHKKYIEKYYGNLFCPECHEPQLSLIKNSFLRGYRDQRHSNNCSKSFKPVSKKNFENLLQDVTSLQQVNNRLKKIIERLLLNKNEKNNPFLAKINDDSCELCDIVPSEVNNRNSICRIPCKSLNAPFYDDDYNTLKIFYGKVDMKLSKRENKKTNMEFYVLNFYKPDINYTLCSISMSTAVYSHFIQLYNISLEIKYRNVYVAFATCLGSYNGFKRGRLAYSNHCVIIGL